jgi:hypothetical protein
MDEFNLFIKLNGLMIGRSSQGLADTIALMDAVALTGVTKTFGEVTSVDELCLAVPRLE